MPFAAVLFVENLDVLVIVHLHEQDPHARSPALGRQRERFAESQEPLVKLACFIQVFHIQRDVCYAQDSRPFNRLSREQATREGRSQHHLDSHLLHHPIPPARRTPS